MASTPLPGSPRHVGRVIDPAVREDGELEPALELDAASSRRAQSEHAEETAAHSEAFREPDAQSDAALDDFGDLDEIGRAEHRPATHAGPAHPPKRAPSAPLPPDPLGRRGRLSPNQQLLFTTLLGVATVASLIALASNIDLSLRRAAPGPPAAAAPALNRDVPAGPQAKRIRNKLPGPWRIPDAKDSADTRLVEGQIQGDAFLTALENAGIEQRESYRILTSMKGVRDLDRCKRSDRFRVLIDRSGSRVRAFEYIVGPGEVYQSREGEDGLLRGAKLDLALAYNRVTGSLVFDGTSFDASAEYAGFDPGLRRVVAKALAGHMDLNELDRGDRIRLVAQERTVLGDFGAYEGVEAIEVLPSADGRAPLRVYYFDHPIERGYYNSAGEAPYDGGWRRPVKDARITSPFNTKRLHPILKRVVPHLGIDFAAAPGTAVGAAAPGIVSFVGFAGPTGNFVRIDHSNQLQTGYAHLSRFAEGLKVGDRVKRLQVIGYVGSTGRSTGPHLHFSAKRNDEFFDPANLRLDALRTVSKESRETFTRLKASYDSMLDALALPAPLPAAAAPSTPPLATANPPAPSASALSSLGGARADTEASESDGEEEPGALNATSNAGKSMVHLTDQELLELSGDAADGEVAE